MHICTYNCNSNFYKLSEVFYCYPSRGFLAYTATDVHALLKNYLEQHSVQYFSAY